MKRVGYPGIKGTFSDEAGQMYFKNDYDGVGLGTFEEVCKAVKEGDVEHAVLPIENSSTGSIGEVFDLIQSYDLLITGEKKLFIEHHLLGLPGSKLEEIECVYSHPQAFKQCYESLKEIPNAEQVMTATTANGVKAVTQKNSLKQAAIASKYAAKTYGLELLKRNIQDKKGNATRFLILTGEAYSQNVANKLSLSFVLKHEPGALAELLTLIAGEGYNLAHIESRPVPNTNWSYRFFLDVDCSQEDREVNKLLNKIKEVTQEFRLVGRYKADLV